jgi:hypothetical protein
MHKLENLATNHTLMYKYFSLIFSEMLENISH